MNNKISTNKLYYFKRKLLTWFESNKRNFPWRENNKSCYDIAIAEIFLQRTRAETVKKVYSVFISHFKNWEDIDKASLEDIGAFLKELGLWRQRSIRLKALANYMNEHNGEFPSDESQLRKLPLMGQYIANTILTQCHNKKNPFLDSSMARLLERYFSPRKLVDIRYDPFLQKLAYQAINKRDIEDVKKINWAILDFAAKVCKQQPNCSVCPLSKKCTFFNKSQT